MLDTRRSFLRSVGGASGSLLLFQQCPPIPEPRRRVPVDPPPPLEKQDDAKPDTNSVIVRRHVQEKELRQTMDQLFTRVRDLKVELDRTPTTEVFSVSIFKETQEIEKLAKRLKSYAKG